VTSSDRRAKEAKKLGFAGAIAPASKPKNAFIRPVTDLRGALNQYLKA
jgi:predicted ATP-dependent serine protease